MNFSTVRAFACLGFVLLLSSCGQKGALTLPDTSGATPIIIREGQTATPPAPASSPAAAPAITPASPTPPKP